MATIFIEDMTIDELLDNMFREYSELETLKMKEPAAIAAAVLANEHKNDSPEAFEVYRDALRESITLQDDMMIVDNNAWMFRQEITRRRLSVA